jgi:hypothetical protein
MGSHALWQVEENRTRIYDMRFTIDEAAGLSNRKSEIVNHKYGGAVAQLVER